jgi:hypothetical protein
MNCGYSSGYAQLPVETQRLMLAAAAGGVGIWDYDIDADVLFCDARWYEILGIDPALRTISSINDFKPFIHPDDVERATDVNPSTLAELVANDDKYQNVFRIIRPSGEVRWLRSAACLVDAQSGRPRRAIGFVKDITERHESELHLRQSLQAQREAEERLREANATLEQRIAERTREYDRAWMHSRDLQVVAGADGLFRAVSPA